MLLFFSFNLFLSETFRFNTHCHCVDVWINAGKMSTQEKENNGFDGMEKKKKKKKKRQEERINRGNRERENLKKKKKMMSGSVRGER